jgi:hypothetical protein
MAKTNSQTSQIVLTISEEFCPRLIVVDGFIQYVSSVGCGFFTGSILWLPSSTKLIVSESLSKNQSFSIVFEKGSNMGNLGEEVFSNTRLLFVQIPASVEFLGEKCFSYCGSLSSVTFETGSRLSQIEKEAFRETALVEIIIPASVEFVDSECFADFRSLSSTTFECSSRLSRIGKLAFYRTG